MEYTVIYWYEKFKCMHPTGTCPLLAVEKGQEWDKKSNLLDVHKRRENIVLCQGKYENDIREFCIPFNNIFPLID